MINNFNFYCPTRILLGTGTEKEAGKLVKEYGGSHVLLVYGGKSAVRSGLLTLVKASLESEGIDYSELGGVVPNPHLEKVYEGIRIGKATGCDFLLAIGGGSAVDTAKAIGYGLAEPDRDVWELFRHVRKPAACLPIGCVITIAAAGSETSKSCVITNKKTGEKRSCNSAYACPKFTLMNPELTKTLPDYQTESGCTDIMMHTMERYFTNGAKMELTDAIAEGLLTTVMKNALLLHEEPDNYDARAEVMWAGSLSHNGLTGCGNTADDFVPHKLEHELGGMYDVTHGAGLAAIWGSWARYVYRDCLPRFVRYATHVMNVNAKTSDAETALAGIEATEDFFHKIGMPITLTELGISPTEEEIEKMAESIAGAYGEIGSAKKLAKEDFIAIYRAAK